MKVCEVGWLHNLQPLLIWEGASRMESWVDTVLVLTVKTNDPDSCLANKLLLPRPPSSTPTSSEPKHSVHMMSPVIERGNPSLLLLATKNSEGIPSRKARINMRL